MVSSFVVLTFAVHGTVQARKDNKRIADLAYGVTIPSLIFIVIMVLYGRRMDASMLIVVGLLLCCVGLLLNRGRPLAMASIMLAMFFAIFVDETMGSRIITQERSFFGCFEPASLTIPIIRGRRPCAS